MLKTCNICIFCGIINKERMSELKAWVNIIKIRIK